MARALLATDWTRESMTDAARRVLVRRGQTPKNHAAQLVDAVLAAFPDAPGDRARTLARFLDDHALADVRGPVPRRSGPPTVHHATAVASRMLRNRWGVPVIDDLAALATFLDLTTGELHWFADVRAYNRRTTHEELRHYRYTWLPKRDGRARLIEQPKPRLKAIQRRILRDVLSQVPTHEAAHGFVTGRSALTAASPHCGRRIVIRLDLEEFFSSVPASRIYGIFRSCGYPETVAHTLTGLVTTSVPVARLRELRGPNADASRRRLRSPHLPQGAPTSPMLANLSALRLDRRMQGLAARLEATYTRYADDLLLSGGSRLASGHACIRSAAEQIVRSEGFAVQSAKTAVMTDGHRQALLGLVVNRRLNVTRESYDALKATLHNAIRTGPEAQRRDVDADLATHLAGRIGWIAAGNPERGARLRAMYDRIDWSASSASPAPSV